MAKSRKKKFVYLVAAVLVASLIGLQFGFSKSFGAYLPLQSFNISLEQITESNVAFATNAPSRMGESPPLTTEEGPHAGAYDEFGSRGYVHDPYFLRKQRPRFPCVDQASNYSVCELPFGAGVEGSKGYSGLQKIQIHNGSSLKLLCMLYTHSKEDDLVQAVLETYAPHCDGFLAASDQTNQSLGKVNILRHGPEAYNNIWQKVRSMMAYAYDYYRNDFDLYHFGGNDMYILPENLKYMASLPKWNHSKPLLFGGPMVAEGKRKLACAGGTGYTINRVGLQTFVEDLMPTCAHNVTSSTEDFLTARCFRTIGVQCADTNDDQNRTRFIGGDVTWQARQNGRLGPRKPKVLAQLHGIATLPGLAGLSPEAVAFHLKPLRHVGNAPCNACNAMRRYHAILYGKCETDCAATISSTLSNPNSTATSSNASFATSSSSNDNSTTWSVSNSSSAPPASGSSNFTQQNQMSGFV